MLTSAKVSPSLGGCWFCYTKDDSLVFDVEFDTWVHQDCIRKAIETDPDDPEAQIMSYLIKNQEG